MFKNVSVRNCAIFDIVQQKLYLRHFVIWGQYRSEPMYIRPIRIRSNSKMNNYKVIDIRQKASGIRVLTKVFVNVLSIRR